MRKIPADAEATTVLVGELPCLDKPALSFVRLAEGTLLDGLTEVPIPVRFLFVLLGPGGDGVDYHEIGRCFSTLMSGEVGQENCQVRGGSSTLTRTMSRFVFLGGDGVDCHKMCRGFSTQMSGALGQLLCQKNCLLKIFRGSTIFWSGIS